jgi:uncharacterized protein YjbJ (UPF0337 family)
MDKNIVKGKAKQVEGRAEDIAGNLSNDLGMEVEGKAKRVAGKVQEEFGKAKDSLRHETRRTSDE